MKRRIIGLILFSSFLTLAQAQPSELAEKDYAGYYLGLQYGLLDFNYAHSDYTRDVNRVNKALRFTVQGYLGYSFSKYWSLEISYQYYGHPRFESGVEKQYLLQQGGHLVAKLNIPLANNFSTYLKGGAELVFRSALESRNGKFTEHAADCHLVPVVSGGICYWVSKELGFDFSVTSSWKVSDLPAMQTYAVGFIYRF